MLLLENDEITHWQKEYAQGNLNKYVQRAPVVYFHYQDYRYTTAEGVIAQGSRDDRAFRRGCRS